MSSRCRSPHSLSWHPSGCRSACSRRSPRDLHISEGVAGQAIAISGAFALVTSLFISSLAGQLDRKVLLLLLTLLMIVSGTVAAFAPNYGGLHGRPGAHRRCGWRLLVDVCRHGDAPGFHASCSARPGDRERRQCAGLRAGRAGRQLPRRRSSAGVGAFFSVVPVAAIVLVWKWIGMPSMKAERRSGSANVFKLLKRPSVALGMAASALFFMGQFALFTYLRPFLEDVTGVGAGTLSLLLLLIGAAGFVGTTLIGRFLKQSLYRTLAIIPALMALIATALVFLGGSFGRDHRPAWHLGTCRHRGAGRLVDLALAHAAAGCGSRRRLARGGRSASHHARRDSRRPALRHERLPGHVWHECCAARTRGRCSSSGGAMRTADQVDH